LQVKSYLKILKYDTSYPINPNLLRNFNTPKDLIKANKRRLDNSKKQYTNFITVNNSSTKYLFLSDQIVEDFQLEKELFLKFSGNNTSNQPKLDKKRSFKQ